MGGFYPLLCEEWDEKTSSDPEGWSPGTPSNGQCAVTALITQDWFQGDIVRAYAVLVNGHKISHYYNRIGGEDVDLTQTQFPESTHYEIRECPPGFDTLRDYMLSDPNTRSRYELLRARVHANWYQKMKVETNTN